MAHTTEVQEEVQHRSTYPAPEGQEVEVTGSKEGIMALVQDSIFDDILIPWKNPTLWWESILLTGLATCPCNIFQVYRKIL